MAQSASLEEMGCSSFGAVLDYVIQVIYMRRKYLCVNSNVGSDHVSPVSK